jgi:hypothetical protein
MAFSTDPLALIEELVMRRLFSKEEAIHPFLALLYVISIPLLGFGLTGKFLRGEYWTYNVIFTMFDRYSSSFSHLAFKYDMAKFSSLCGTAAYIT